MRLKHEMLVNVICISSARASVNVFRTVSMKELDNCK